MQEGFYQDLCAARDDAETDYLTAALYALSTIEDAIDDLHYGQQVGRTRDASIKVLSTPLRRVVGSALRRLAPVHALTAAEKVASGQDLVALASDLYRTGHLKSTIEVCESIWARFASTWTVSLPALQQKGHAQRMLKDFASATLTFDSLIAFASAHHLESFLCEGRLGHAKVAIDRGDLDVATASLKALVPRAKKLGIRDLIARICIGRSSIAGMRNDPVRSIVHSNKALEHADDDGLRCEILFNMSMAFREADDGTSAVAIADYLVERGNTAYVRSLAAIHRVNLAVDVEDYETALGLADSIGDRFITPQVEADFSEAMSRFHADTGRFDLAEAAARRTVDLAAKNGMGEVLQRAEQALRDIRCGVVPAVYTFRPVKVTTAARAKLATVAKALPILRAA